MDTFGDGNGVAFSYWDPGPASISFQHSFELSSSESVHHCKRRMASKHNKIFRDDLEVIISSSIVTPAKSGSQFLELVVKETNGNA